MSAESNELLVEAVDILESNDLLGDNKRESMQDKLSRSLQRVVDKAVTASTEFHFATAQHTHTFTDSVGVLDLEISGTYTPSCGVVHLDYFVSMTSMKKTCPLVESL